MPELNYSIIRTDSRTIRSDSVSAELIPIDQLRNHNKIR